MPLFRRNRTVVERRCQTFEKECTENVTFLALFLRQKFYEDVLQIKFDNSIVKVLTGAQALVIFRVDGNATRDVGWINQYGSAERCERRHLFGLHLCIVRIRTDDDIIGCDSSVIDRIATFIYVEKLQCKNYIL